MPSSVKHLRQRQPNGEQDLQVEIFLGLDDNLLADTNPLCRFVHVEDALAYPKRDLEP